MSEIKNAIITAATIGIERGFMLDSWLHLDYGNSGRGFGGFCLHTLPKDGELYDADKTIPVAGHWIMKVLQIAGVESWSDLSGKTIRVKIDGEMGKIVAIGHIVKDMWFNPREDFSKMREGIKDEQQN